MRCVHEPWSRSSCGAASRPAGDSDATLHEELPEVKSCRSSLVVVAVWVPCGRGGSSGTLPSGPWVCLFKMLLSNQTLCIWGAGGATPGKFLLGLRVVTCDTSTLVRPNRVLVVPASSVSLSA